MFQLQWFDKNRQEWLQLACSDSKQVVEEILGNEHGIANAEDPSQFQIVEFGKRRTTQEVFEDAQKDAIEAAQRLSRIAQVLEGTKFESATPADRDADLCRLQGKMRSLFHDMNSLSDEFFSWHNEVIRRSREAS